jgi:hypothetical protein
MALVVEREGQRVALCVQMGSVKECTNQRKWGWSCMQTTSDLLYETFGTWASHLAGKLKDEKIHLVTITM